MTLAKMKNEVLKMFRRERLSKEPWYLTGYTLMLLTERIGHPVRMTTDSQYLLCNELYSVDERGIFLIK